MKVIIKFLTVGLWRENSYSIEYGEESWLIDPGDDFAALDKFFSPKSGQLKGILNTHGHFDHIGAVSDFKDKYDIPFYIHSKDKRLISQANLYRKLAGGKTTFKTPEADVFLDDISSISIEDKAIKIHRTPGHTGGSVCYEIENNIFTGDLFFKNSLGRTDLPGGDEKLSKDSVNFILDEFQDYTVYPGHGKPFSLDKSVTMEIRSLL